MEQFREQVWQKSISCPDRKNMSRVIERERGPGINSESELQKLNSESGKIRPGRNQGVRL